MPITRSVRQLTIEAVVNPWADRQRRCEWPSGLRMATLPERLVNLEGRICSLQRDPRDRKFDCNGHHATATTKEYGQCAIDLTSESDRLSAETLEAKEKLKDLRTLIEELKQTGEQADELQAEVDAWNEDFLGQINQLLPIQTLEGLRAALKRLS